MKKKILFTVLVGMLVLTTACGKKDNKTDDEKTKVKGEIANTKENVIKEVNIDGLNIQNVTLIYNTETGRSSFSADVVNTTDTPIDVKSFDIRFLDNAGNEVTTLNGYIGEVLEPNQSKNILGGAGLDLSNIESIEYTRNYN